MIRRMLIVALFPVAGVAQEAPVEKRESPYRPMENWDYYCTDGTGNRVEIGEVICITASCLSWTARCEMAANNNLAMWRKLQDGCPGASLLYRIERLQPGLDPGAVHAEI